MPKATDTTTTPQTAAQAVTEITPLRPTRRRMFSGILAGATLAGAASALASIPKPEARAVEPLVQLYRQILDLEMRSAAADQRCRAITAQQPMEPAARIAAWRAADAECTAAIGEQSELILQMMDMPATTAAGVIAKLLVAAMLAPPEVDHAQLDFYEDMARNAVLDAALVLPVPGWEVAWRAA